jgi:hypothetical protein
VAATPVTFRNSRLETSAGGNESRSLMISLEVWEEAINMTANNPGEPAGTQSLPERPPWAQRTFSFSHPPWMIADFIERLRGVLPRLDALLVGLDGDRAHRQLEGKWSIAQNIGHLSDVEELWQERLEDLRQGKKTYTPAAPARFQALATRHQDRSVLETMQEFRSRRSRLIDALAEASPDLQRAAAFHERLQVPMRLVDCAQFCAEHDDHHLIRIRRLLTT